MESAALRAFLVEATASRCKGTWICQETATRGLQTQGIAGSPLGPPRPSDRRQFLGLGFESLPWLPAHRVVQKHAYVQALNPGLGPRKLTDAGLPRQGMNAKSM